MTKTFLTASALLLAVTTAQAQPVPLNTTTGGEGDATIVGQEQGALFAGGLTPGIAIVGVIGVVGLVAAASDSTSSTVTTSP